MRSPRLSPFLFCYGTLMFPELLEQVCGRRLAWEEAVLKGYACYRLRDEVFPGVVVAPRGQVQGLLYHGVGARTLRRLDRYEDDCYDRRLLRVRDARGRPRMAWVYVVAERHRQQLSDAPWDMREFQRRYLAGWLRRPGA